MSILTNVFQSPHLFKNHRWADNDFLTQFLLGLWCGAIKLGDQVAPLSPQETAGSRWLWDAGYRSAYDIVKSDAVPALYAKDVKVIDFEFRV